MDMISDSRFAISKPSLFFERQAGDDGDDGGGDGVGDDDDVEVDGRRGGDDLASRRPCTRGGDVGSFSTLSSA